MKMDVGEKVEMETESKPRRYNISIYLQIAVGAAVFVVLFIISRNNYLLFHGIAEIFSSIVAFTIFVLAWHTRRYTENDYLLFLGIAYLFVGILDLIHMLAYTGMGVFTGYGTNLATQLWIAARYIEAASLLLAPLFLVRRLKAWVDIGIYTVIFIFILVSIFYLDIFPTCFVEGSGLTPFKKISEYVIALILVGAIVVLFRKREEFDPKVFWLVVSSISLTVASELCFTLYQDPYAFFNMLGHFLKIISFYLIYRAIVDTGLEEPYELLFRKLNEKEKMERAILDATADSLILQDLDGRILAINEVAARILGGNVDELVGSDIAQFIPPVVFEEMKDIIEEMVGERVSVRSEEEHGGRWYETTYYPVLSKEGDVGMLAVYSRDITERKKAEKALNESRERWRKSFDAIGDAMMVLDRDMRILQHNDALCGLLGREGNFTGRKCYELIHGTDEPPDFCVCLEAVACRQRVREDFYEPVLGKHLWASFSPVFEDSGEMEFGLHVIQDISESKRVEEDLRRYSHDLEERVKELNCLFAISRIIETAEFTLEEILDRVVDILPPAWQYPEVTCARLILNDLEYITEDFEKSPWSLSSDIRLFGDLAGTVEVFYREEMPQSDEGPFLAEERGLIDAIAERLGRVAERKTMVEALRQSEEKYRLIVDSAQEGVWTVDADNVTTFVNVRMADMLGYEVGEMEGRSIFAFMDEEGRKIALMNIERRREGISEQHDFELLKKDGTRIYASLESSPLLGENGEYMGALAMVADITERKLAEEVLRESEERLRTMANASGDYIMMLDTDHRIRFINRTEEGIDPDSVIGIPLYELVDREEHAHIRSHLDQVIADASKQEYETVYHRPDGTEVYYSSVAMPLVVGGEVIGSVVNSRDITGRKTMEKALRESEENFRSIVEQSSDGITLVDQNGVIIEWNSAQEDITGLRREKAVGKPFWDVQYLLALPEQKTPAAYEKLKGSVLESLEKGYASWFGETSESELQSPDGMRRIVQAVTFPIRSSEGTMVGSITRDITRRVRMEEMLAFDLEANSAVAELSATLLSQASIEDVSYIVLEKAKQLTESPFGFVGHIESETGYLISSTLSRDIWDDCGIADKSVVFKEFKGLWGWVLDNKKPLLTNEPHGDPRSTGVPHGHIPIERFVSVPALLGGALVGQIALANSGRDYNERDIDLLNRLADLYAMAVLRMWSEEELDNYREHLEELVRERTLELERINLQLQEEVSERKKNQEELRTIAEQLRALSARVESVREEERRRVAREVHDTLGQALTGLKINLSLLGRKLAGETELEERIVSMSDLVDTTIKSVREIATELRPGVLDDLGLAAALDWQVKRFGELMGLESSFTSDTDDSLLDKDLTIALFRIAQEALTNIARHAEASRVDVRLAHERGSVVLEIKDDGKGIEKDESGDWGALGILGMRERAHMFGGEVEIRGSRGAGTMVIVSIPSNIGMQRDDGEDVGEEEG
jgi:PAS domain S-box-containing protein